MDKALQTMIDNMPEKTGKPLTEWKRILKAIHFFLTQRGQVSNLSVQDSVLLL